MTFMQNVDIIEIKQGANVFQTIVTHKGAMIHGRRVELKPVIMLLCYY